MSLREETIVVAFIYPSGVVQSQVTLLQGDGGCIHDDVNLWHVFSGIKSTRYIRYILHGKRIRL